MWALYGSFFMFFNLYGLYLHNYKAWVALANLQWSINKNKRKRAYHDGRAILFPTNKLLEYFVSQKFHMNKKNLDSVTTKNLWIYFALYVHRRKGNHILVKAIILHFGLHNSCNRPIPSPPLFLAYTPNLKPSHSHSQPILLLTSCFLFLSLYLCLIHHKYLKCEEHIQFNFSVEIYVHRICPRWNVCV